MRMDKSWTTECEVFYSCTMGRSHTLQQISHRAVSGHSLSSSWTESTGSGRKSRGKTAALHGAPMGLHQESPAPEIRDAAPSAKPAWGSAAAPCDPGGTARGDGSQLHLLLEQLIHPWRQENSSSHLLRECWKEQGLTAAAAHELFS